MEIRTLKYFLAVAQEENITKAADLLHLTQPTLSRQMMQLEEELGVKLFHRGKYRVILTDDGLLLKQRAQEIVELAEKTRQDFLSNQGELSGKISLGCGESRSMTTVSKLIASFRERYPLVQFNIYSANADDIKSRIESGLLDLGLLTEPVDIGRYEFMRMSEKDRWGILVPKDAPLAEKEFIVPEDLLHVPLLIVAREMVRQELAGWFGDLYDQIHIAATHNLILNVANMVKNGVGVALCFDLDNGFDDLKFVPLKPELKTGSVLVWKKEQAFSAAASKFIEFIKNRD